MCLSLVGTFLV